MQRQLLADKLLDARLRVKSKRIPGEAKATFAYTKSNYFLAVEANLRSQHSLTSDLWISSLIFYDSRKVKAKNFARDLAYAK